MAVASTFRAFDVVLESVKKVLSENEELKKVSSIADEVFSSGKKMCEWLEDPKSADEANEFSERVVAELQVCIPGPSDYKSTHTRREWMWSNYHRTRCTGSYISLWKRLLSDSVKVKPIPLLFQSVGDAIFKTLIKANFPVNHESSAALPSNITELELKALQYAAGYIPRAIRTKLQQCKESKQRNNLLLCLYDLLDDGEEDSDEETSEWLNAVDRGGLTRINEMTFQVFLAMEMELRENVHRNLCLDGVAEKLMDNEDVQFYWAMLSADWEEAESRELLQEVVKLFVTIRGFSIASNWVEQYKTTTTKTLEKSKGLRKNLMGSATCTSSSTSTNKS